MKEKCFRNVGAEPVSHPTTPRLLGNNYICDLSRLTIYNKPAVLFKDHFLQSSNKINNASPMNNKLDNLRCPEILCKKKGTLHANKPEAKGLITISFLRQANPLIILRFDSVQGRRSALPKIAYLSSIGTEVFVTLPTLKYGVYSAVCAFIDGFKSKVETIEKLGFWPGTNLVKAMKLLEAKKAQDLQKKLRYSRALKRKRLEDRFEEEEDSDNHSYRGGHY
ncbi:hypothetical protein J6590_032712 [Homalodisca vitripennis]|nr:hypothetical protein J6590_032712 [Homalodisca vitripennis]